METTKPTAASIAAHLRQRILDGRRPEGDRHPDAIPPGGRLPTVNQLVESYLVARGTASAVIEQLKNEGLVLTGPGGTIAMDTDLLFTVRSEAFDKHEREGSIMTTVETACAERGLETWTDHRFELVDQAPDWTGLDGPAVHWSGENYVQVPVDGGGHTYVVPVLIYNTYVTQEVAASSPQLTEPRTAANKALWTGGIWSAVERGTGLQIRRRPLDIIGRMSDAEEAERMQLGSPGPVLVEHFAAITDDGQKLVANEYIRRFGTVVYRFDLPVGD